MSDKYISQEAIKNALVDKFKARIGSSHVPTWNDAFDAVTNLPPAADVVEVRHGQWYLDNGCAYCSECKNSFAPGIRSQALFCPRCGAKMDGGKDND